MRVKPLLQYHPKHPSSFSQNQHVPTVEHNDCCGFGPHLFIIIAAHFSSGLLFHTPYSTGTQQHLLYVLLLESSLATHPQSRQRIVALYVACIQIFMNIVQLYGTGTYLNQYCSLVGLFEGRQIQQQCQLQVRTYSMTTLTSLAQSAARSRSMDANFTILAAHVQGCVETTLPVQEPRYSKRSNPVMIRSAINLALAVY